MTPLLRGLQGLFICAPNAKSTFTIMYVQYHTVCSIINSLLYYGNIEFNDGRGLLIVGHVEILKSNVLIMISYNHD